MQWRHRIFRCFSVVHLLLLLLTATDSIEQHPSDYDPGPVDDDPDRGQEAAAIGGERMGVDGESAIGELEGRGRGRGDRHKHRRRWEETMVESIKEKILLKLGRTNTTVAGGRKRPTAPGVSDAGAAGAEDVSLVQVQKTIVLSEIPVLNASANGTLEFILRRNSNLHRIDKVELHLRISALRTAGHRLRHHANTPSISVMHLTRPGDALHVDPRTDGSEPLPIARSSIRIKDSGRQRVPLPSSVVQEVLESGDPVLRLAFFCENCEVLPSSTSRSSTHHRRRDEGSYFRKRHGSDLPYITLSTFDFLEKK